MNFQRFTGPGSLPSRRALWDKIFAAVISAQKNEGKNVSVDVHDGLGTIINLPFPERGRPPTPPTGACCVDGVCSITTEADCEGDYQGNGTTCDDVDCSDCTDSDCRNGACCNGSDCTITSPSECAGEFQGRGTVCEPNPCVIVGVGACCVDGVCSQTTEEDCAGVFQGVGVPCDPDPCTECPACAFFNADDGRYYLRRDFYVIGDYFHVIPPDHSVTAHYETVRTDECVGGENVCTGSGDGTYDVDSDPPCHCDLTFFCDDPIVAFGFWGESGLTFNETCSGTPGSGICENSGIVVCDFDECDFVENTVYSIPCIPP